MVSVITLCVLLQVCSFSCCEFCSNNLLEILNFKFNIIDKAWPSDGLVTQYPADVPIGLPHQ